MSEVDPLDRYDAYDVEEGAMSETQWQPIETAPKDTPILGFDPNGSVDDGPVYAVIHWWTDQSYHFEVAKDGLYRRVADEPWSMWSGAEYSPFRATHWMSLPKPPKEPQ